MNSMCLFIKRRIYILSFITDDKLILYLLNQILKNKRNTNKLEEWTNKIGGLIRSEIEPLDHVESGK